MMDWPMSRVVVLLVGLPAVTALLAVSIAMNFRFGMSLGAGVDGMIYGGASASADILKSLMPFVLAWAMGKGRWTIAVASSVLWIVFTGYSLTSSLGFSAKTRADTTAGRQVVAERYADNRAALKDVVARLATLPVVSSAPMLDVALKTLRRHHRWKATSGCSDATIPASIQYCKRYADTLSEFQSARQRVELERQRQELQRRLDVLADRGVVSQADPQIGFLVQLLPVSKTAVRNGLILMVALLVELGSGLGFYVLIGHGGNRTSRDGDDSCAVDEADAPQALLPAPRVVYAEPCIEAVAAQQSIHWLIERVARRSSAHAPGTLLYEDFCAWVVSNNAADMTFTEFCQWLERQGFTGHRHNGRLQYRGLYLLPLKQTEKQVVNASS